MGFYRTWRIFNFNRLPWLGGMWSAKALYNGNLRSFLTLISAETNKGSLIPTMPFKAPWNEPYQPFVDRELSSRTLTVRHEGKTKPIPAHTTGTTWDMPNITQDNSVCLKQAQHRKFRGHPPDRGCSVSSKLLTRSSIHSFKTEGPCVSLEINILSTMGIQRYKTSTSQIIKCIQQLTPPHIYLVTPAVKIKSCWITCIFDPTHKSTVPDTQATNKLDTLKKNQTQINIIITDLEN